MSDYATALVEAIEATKALVEIGETAPDSVEFALARKRQLAANAALLAVMKGEE